MKKVISNAGRLSSTPLPLSCPGEGRVVSSTAGPRPWYAFTERDREGLHVVNDPKNRFVAALIGRTGSSRRGTEAAPWCSSLSTGRSIDEWVVRVKDKGDLYVHQDANWNVIIHRPGPPRRGAPRLRPTASC